VKTALPSGALFFLLGRQSDSAAPFVISEKFRPIPVPDLLQHMVRDVPV
jgi:hypothetical protein